MKRIGFTGSFDPLTKGHLWVIEEALNVAEEVLVFVAVNNSKKPMFTIDERIALITASTQHLNGKVTVIAVEGNYTAQVAKEEYDCEYLIRGIRNAGDFDYESLIQQTNRDVLGGAKTIFVFPPRDLDSVSSSFVKSLMGPVGWHYYVEEFLPPAVIQYWINKEITRIISPSQYVEDNMKLNSHEFMKKFNHLLEMYESPSRIYHSKAHILYMLQLLNTITLNSSYANMLGVITSILAHDCIMEDSSDESAEELSAKYLEGLGVPHIGINSIADAVRATAYLSNHELLKKIELNDYAKILVSLDLAILGSNGMIYRKYTEKVRKEYSRFSDMEYFNGRITALEKLIKFSESGSLIPLAELKDLNNRAIVNMKNEIKELKVLAGT